MLKCALFSNVDVLKISGTLILFPKTALTSAENWKLRNFVALGEEAEVRLLSCFHGKPLSLEPACAGDNGG